jgi:hemoglobin-like flavoprotein
MNVSLLRESFELVIDRQPQLVTRFYTILFQRFPQARALFGRNASAAQEKMLAEALVAVLDHIEDAAWFRATLGALGAKHAGYGVTEEMYDWVGECLLAALAEAAGEAWSDELQHAWSSAYAAIAAAMLDGADKVQAAA